MLHEVRVRRTADQTWMDAVCSILFGNCDWWTVTCHRETERAVPPPYMGVRSLMVHTLGKPTFACFAKKVYFCRRVLQHCNICFSVAFAASLRITVAYYDIPYAAAAAARATVLL